MRTIFFALLFLPVFANAQVKKKQLVRQHSKTKVRSPLPTRSLGTHGVVAPVERAEDTVGITRMVDEQPAFPGGRDAWIRFLQNNIDPMAVSDADQTSFGRRQSVRVQFVVCEDGSLCNYTVVNKTEVGQSAANEAMRVMRKSPNWEPGIYKNKKAKTRFIQPITFVFEE